MDVLAGGSERPPSRAAELLSRLPARTVAPLLAAVLAAGLLGVGQVEQAQREAEDVSAVQVRLVVEQTRRAGDGSAYGFARVQVDDPAGRDVRLQALDADVPGVRLGPRELVLAGPGAGAERGAAAAVRGARLRRARPARPGQRPGGPLGPPGRAARAGR